MNSLNPRQKPSKVAGDSIDELEAAMANSIANGAEHAAIHVVHRFTPGLYIRECHIPKGALLTSATHKTRHPFVISAGRIRVISETEHVEYAAPFTGVTEPGTRRMLYALDDTIWTTFHVTEETDILKIGEQILEPHQNSLLPENHPALSHGWASQPHNLPQS